MDDLKYVGKFLLIFGFVIAVFGLMLSSNIKLPTWIGRLPGDIFVQSKNFSLYFPLMTCLLVSLLLTILFWFIEKK
jgi:hypothetical protein